MTDQPTPPLASFARQIALAVASHHPGMSVVLILTVNRVLAASAVVESVEECRIMLSHATESMLHGDLAESADNNSTKN